MRIEGSFSVWFGVGMWLAASFAQANDSIIGPGAVKTREESQPALCRIRVENTSEINQCSGTLVGPTEVATAAHCFGKFFRFNRSNVSVTCGGRTAEVEDVALPERDRWLDRIKPLPSGDYARISLSRPLDRWIPKAKGHEPYFVFTKGLVPGVRCWMAGFGNSRSSQFGTLYIAELTSYSLIYGAGVIALKDPDEDYLDLSADHGDSGGSLYCQVPGKPIELVGVIVSYQPEFRSSRNRVDNLFAPIWNQSL